MINRIQAALVARRSTWLRLFWLSLQRFEQQQRRRDAAALTYTTLFALVPVITVSYSILSAIPALQSWGEQANQQLLAYIMPQGSSLVSDYLTRFSQQARQLTWVGVVFLFITALLLLRTIEAQFNRIWNVEMPRSGVTVFLRYWAILSLGPLLFGAAFAVSSLIAAAPLWADTTRQIPGIAHVLPWMFSSGALMALYTLVPNCRVPWRHALFAALFVATVFELAKYLFARIIGLFPSYQLIYGAFAAVPLFLVWMYFAWNLLLYGAELSFNFAHLKQSDRPCHPLWLRLQIVSRLLHHQQQGAPLTQALLEQQLSAFDPDDIDAFIQRALQQGWLIRSEYDALCWLADPQQQSLQQLFGDLSLHQWLQPVDSEVSGGPGSDNISDNRRDSSSDNISDSSSERDPLAAAIKHWQQQLTQDVQACVDQPVAGLLNRNLATMPAN